MTDIISVFREANMNWNRLQTGCRISVQLVLVILIMIASFYQFLKFRKEITNVSISYNDGKQGLELPSITFCPFINSEVYRKKQENVTFEEYMEHVSNVSDLFDSVFQVKWLVER